MEIYAGVTKLPVRKSNGPSWRIDERVFTEAPWLDEFFGRLLGNGRTDLVGFTGSFQGGVLCINFAHSWYRCKLCDGGKRVRWEGDPLVSWDDILQKGNAQAAAQLIFAKLK